MSKHHLKTFRLLISAVLPIKNIAEKSKIILLLSITAEDKSKNQDEKPFTQETLCNRGVCYSDPRSAEADVTDASGGLPAFFSLAALAEVAAMENVHR